MALALTDAQRDDIIDLYLSRTPISEICNRFSISRQTVYRLLKSKGIEPCQKVIPDNADALEAFKRGESVYSIANRLGVSRNVVDRWVRNAGLEHRSCSEAGLLRVAAMTPAERAAQASAAHDAARGRKATVDEKVLRALTVQRNAASGTKKYSSGETAMLGWLTDRGLECTMQKAAWVYNLDIAIGEHFAVEILGGSWHAVKKRRIHEAGRLEYLLNNGWSIVYVWNTSHMPMTERCADKVVSLYKLVSSFPSADGKYWVIRGDGELTAFGGGYIDESAFVLPSQSSQ